jgi:hypothetical protein
MAKRRDLQTGDESDGMDPVSIPGGYVLGKNQRITDILAIEDALLSSEGIDPTWVPYTEAELAEAESLST